MRRFAMTAILVVTVCLVIAAAAANWPQFLGPNGNGSAADGKIKLADKWPEAGPKVLWTQPAGPGFGGPAIHDGKVYLLERGENKDTLRCLKLADGSEDWTYTYDAPGKKLSYNGSRSTPAVDDKYVFTIGAFGHLVCVSKATHQKVWSKNLLSDYRAKMPNWGVAVSPVMYENTVIAAALSKTVGLVCFDKATGRQLWASPAVGPQAYVTPVFLTVGAAKHLVALTVGGKRVIGISPADGKVLWTFRPWKCNAPISAPIDCGGGRLFLTGGYKSGSTMIQVVKQGDGYAVSEVFRLDDMGSILHNAVLYKEHIYVNANTKRTHDGLMCVTLTGEIKWKTGREPNSEKGCVVLADGKLYVLDGKAGVIRMVKPAPAGYTELGSVKVFDRPGRPFWAPMAIDGGKLICRDQKQIKCLDIAAR